LVLVASDNSSTPNLRASRGTSTSTHVVTPSPNRGILRRRRDTEAISAAIDRITRSSFYHFNQTLAEYLIRILLQVREGHIIPISVLMCPHRHMDLACGGRGCENNTYCPTAEILKIFSEALPDHEINFANPGQPINNIMVINGREHCEGDDCDGQEKTPMPSLRPTFKPTCPPISRIEGQSTAELINLFAEGVHNAGAHVFIVNHGGWGMYKHFFKFLNAALFVAVCARGVHISLYRRRRLAFGRWRTPEVQGGRISSIVKQHSDAIGDVYAQYDTPLVTSIFEYLSMRNTVLFVHQNFLSQAIQQAYQVAVESTRRIYHRLPSIRDARWNEMFSQLQAFRRQYGHTNVPHDQGSLGHWVYNQRRRCRDEERRARLDSIDFSWNRLVDGWNEMFSQLQAFNRQHGHTNVPRDHRIQGSSSLASWVHMQRSGQGMTSERRAMLDTIDFSWNRYVDGWNGMFSQLQAFKAEHGHTNVPRGSPLSNWVNKQRSGQGMTEERRSLLDSIDFTWNTHDAQWNTMFAKLQAFHAEHGHINIPRLPRSYLYDWVLTQRSKNRQGILRDDRHALLDSIGFKW